MAEDRRARGLGHLLQAGEVVLVVVRYEDRLHLGALGLRQHLSGPHWRVNDDALVGLGAHQQIGVVVKGAAGSLVDPDFPVAE